jgi:hypothetical protein
MYVLAILEFYHLKQVRVYLDGVFLTENDIWNYIEKQYYSFVKMINEEGWGINRVVINTTGINVLYNAFDGGSASIVYEIIPYNIWKKSCELNSIETYLTENLNA